MNLDKLREMIERHEGRRHDWYRDTKGLWTCGIGHLATKHDDITQSWTDAQIDANFENDTNIAIACLSANLPWFEQLDEVRKGALIDMCFNMGWGRLSGFHNMLGCMACDDWANASGEAINSKWAREDVPPSRSLEISRMIKTGEWQ